MVELGLVDDEYDEYDAYEEPQAGRPAARGHAVDTAPANSTSGIRTLSREADLGGSGVTVMPRPSVVRPITPAESAKAHVGAPTRFPDAQEIATRFRSNQPVITNM